MQVGYYGRPKIIDMLNPLFVTEINLNISIKAHHLDAFNEEQIGTLIEQNRWETLRVNNPSVPSPPPLDARTMQSIFLDMNLVSVEKPAKKNSRRIIAGEDALNAANWAAMYVATATSDSPLLLDIDDDIDRSKEQMDSVDPSMIANIDSTSFFLEFGNEKIVAITSRDVEHDLRDSNLAVSVRTGSAAGNADGAKQNRSLQFHAVTCADGTLSVTIYEIVDRMFQKYQLFEVKLMCFLIICFVFNAKIW